MNTSAYKSIAKKRIAVGLIALTVVACWIACGAGQSRAFAFNGTDIKPDTTVTIGELLLPDYDTAASGKKVFDGKQFWTLIDALASDTEDMRKIADLSAKDAQAIRDVNDGKDIVVTIDGKQWTVTDLRKLDNGHTIATMWLTTSAETSQWNTWYANTPTDAYPGNMYSTSYIRANALNSGGCGYVATQGATTLTQIAQSADHQYAKFTMQSVKDGSRELSLLDYIVQTKNVAYQGTETIVKYNSSYKTCPNEAWGTPEIESYYNANMNYSGKTHYTEWASDYLWLPSLAETGYSGVTGIWNLSDAQRSNGKDSWLRSGNYFYAGNAFLLNTSGGNDDYRTTDTYAVRPAFHLDLTQAAADATQPVDVPTSGANATDRSKVYNAAEQTFGLQNVDASKMQTTLVVKDPNNDPIDASTYSFDVATGQMRAKYAGTYKFEFALKDPDNTFWWDETGGTDKRTLTFEITPKQLTVSLANNVAGDLWEWIVCDSYTATLTVSGIASGDTIGLKAIYTADAGGAKQEIAATQDGTQTVATIDLSQIAVGTYKLTAALDNTVGESINYSISDGLTSANMPRPFTVRAKTADLTGVGWLHTVQDADGNPIAGQPNLEEIADGAQFRYALHGTLQNYAGYVHRMNIDASKFPKDGDNPIVAVDVLTTTFNGTTYADGYSNALGSTVNRYTSKVLLKIVHDDYLFANNQKQIELSLNWEVLKGTFDLSGIKWKYKYTTDTGTVSNVYDPDTTKLEYNDGKIIRVEIDSTTLPLGLSAPGGIFDYQNASGTLVNAYTATVAGNTLEYDDACFEQPADLVLNWEILGKGIVVKWKPVQSGTYYLKELNCDPKYTTGESKIVHYKYFAPDGSLLGIDEAGRQAIADKVIADNIGPENPQTFTIEAYLDGNNSGNYRLLTNPARTTVSIGNDPFTAVEAQVPETVTYDGNAHYTQDEIQFTGAPIRPTDYTVTYYAGTDLADMSKNTKLDGAPTDAGKYVIEIEMHDDSYVLTPSVFAVEITAKQVAVPTVKEATFNGTEYSLLDLLTGYDATLMTLDLVTTATNAGTYHATVTLPNSNYVWMTADGATGLQEYALEWSISKVKLTEIWGADSSGKPTLTISSKYADYVQIVYEYYDADGNLVAESDLIAGQTYKVVAKLSASSAANFELADINGEVSDTPNESAPKQFTYGYDPNNPNGSGNNDGNATSGGDLANATWFRISILSMVGLLATIAILLLAILCVEIGIRNLRKKNRS